MNINDQLNKLKNIKQVDAPLFMFTRIQQKIKELGHEEVTSNFKWAYAFAAMLILALNIATINLNHTKTSSNLESVVTQMQLKNNNNFYHEQN